MEADYKKKIMEITELSYNIVTEKIIGGVIIVENEASFQLHLASTLKSLGDLYSFRKDDFFNIELEKPVTLEEGLFLKSNSKKAKIDIYISYENLVSKKKVACAIELKYLKKSNHREPNNRYDVFLDLHNLELYNKNIKEVDFGIFIIGTDHNHYVNKESYSKATELFDFRDKKTYSSGSLLEYKTENPYGPPVKLEKSYSFNWDINEIRSFMKLEIN